MARVKKTKKKKIERDIGIDCAMHKKENWGGTKYIKVKYRQTS